MQGSRDRTMASAALPCPLLRLTEGDANDLARVFAALADPVRLRLLSLVAEAGEVCSCDLLEAARQIPAHRLPPHQGPRRAGLIAGTKQGRWVWWRIVPERLDAIRLALAPVSRR